MAWKWPGSSKNNVTEEWTGFIDQGVTLEGTLQLTENTLDIGIRGDGWFNVQLPNGQTAYTRSGSFQLSNRTLDL